jgi:hypothetical protein
VKEEKVVAAKAKEAKLRKILQANTNAEALAKQAAVHAVALLKGRW